MKKSIKKTLIFGPLTFVGLALLFVGWNLVFPSMSKLKTENPRRPRSWPIARPDIKRRVRQRA